MEPVIKDIKKYILPLRGVLPVTNGIIRKYGNEDNYGQHEEIDDFSKVKVLFEYQNGVLCWQNVSLTNCYFVDGESFVVLYSVTYNDNSGFLGLRTTEKTMSWGSNVGINRFFFCNPDKAPLMMNEDIKIVDKITLEEYREARKQAGFNHLV